MLQGLNLIGQVAFLTNRGGIAGNATLGDARTNPTIANPGIATGSYCVLVSGSTQTGAPLGVGVGRYSCQLWDGNQDISPGDACIAWNVTNGTAGGTNAGAFLKVTRTAPSVYEVDVYTALGGIPVLTDFDASTPGNPPWLVQVTWFRIDPH
jgi:hypothetical protein